MKRTSGQMLLLAMLILTVLVISVPIIVYVNSVASRGGRQVMTKNQSVTVALEGIAYATHVLGKSKTVWSSALTQHNSCPAEFVQLVSSTYKPIVYKGASGEPFSIQCISGDPTPFHVQNYQLQLLIHGGIPDPNTGKANFGRAYKVVLSQKTLGVNIPTGVQASAALQLMNVPANAEGLVVHWGPIAIYKAITWTVRNAMDASQFPRKFSQGNITGPTFSRDDAKGTDSKEYWSNSALGFPNIIDVSTYKSSATYLSEIDPTLPSVNLARVNCPGSNVNCANLKVTAGQTAIISGGYRLYKPNTVVYIDGNVRLDDVFMDLRNGGALIVNGNLTLGTPGSSALGLMVRVPPTAGLEYPYFTPGNPWPGNAWPCKAAATSTGGECNTQSTELGRFATNGYGNGNGEGKVQLRGFIYVTGSLTVTDPGWLISGAVRVDKALNVPAFTVNGTPTAPGLTILYDDQINHAIASTPLEFLVDYKKECAACSLAQ